MKANQFTVTINLGTAAMETKEQIAEALRNIADRVEDGIGPDYGSGCYQIRDENGNKVGNFLYK